MSSEFTVFPKAKILLATGERPSLRNVRAGIPGWRLAPRGRQALARMTGTAQLRRQARTQRHVEGYSRKGTGASHRVWKQAKREATQAFAKEHTTVEADAADER